jgi:hypothetical protein
MDFHKVRNVHVQHIHHVRDVVIDGDRSERDEWVIPNDVLHDVVDDVWVIPNDVLDDVVDDVWVIPNDVVDDVLDDVLDDVWVIPNDVVDDVWVIPNDVLHDVRVVLHDALCVSNEELDVKYVGRVVYVIRCELLLLHIDFHSFFSLYVPKPFIINKKYEQSKM